MTTHNPDHDEGRGDWQEYLTNPQLSAEARKVIDALQSLILEGQSAETFVDQATVFVLQKEVEYLTRLLKCFIGFALQAEGCGCGNCKKVAKKYQEQLIDMLILQTERLPVKQAPESLDPRFLAGQEAQRAIRIAEEKIDAHRAKQTEFERQKKTAEALKEWENRAERIRELIEIFMQNKETHFSGDPFTRKERTEIQKLLQEARKRAQARKKNKKGT